MNLPDEPFLEIDAPAEPSSSESLTSEPVAPRIRRLIESQPFAVLCMQGEGQPYGSLVAYAFDDALTWAVFATSKATRKFKLLIECDHVALVIDNRPEFPEELMKIEGLTATGRARLLEDPSERDAAGRFLAARHSYLREFVRSESCGLFRVDIVRFLHVSRFQEVRQWVPTNDS